MDEIKSNVPKTFTDRVSTKMRYLLVLTAMVAMAAVGYTFLPDAEVSAQEAETKPGVAADAPEVATQAMIDFAIGALHTASEYTVYAERGINDKGGSTVRGTKADALRSAEGRKSTKELSNSIDAMRQLPCTELKSSDLTGKSFNPGVYCLQAAELNGEMTLDSGGNAAGTYIFRVAGSLNAKSGSGIRLENGAQGGNVFFVAEEATIGNDASFRANILTKGNVSIGTGATVTDKVMSLGKVEMGNSAILGGTTGTMEICKEEAVPVDQRPEALENRIYHFVVTGATGIGTAANPVKVPVGSCSSPFDVTAGPQTVTELNNGTLITPPNGTFSGNFELIDVTNLTPASTSTLGLVNLATRVANVNIVAGGVNQQLTLQFTNRRTITGFIEICKRAATGPGQFNPAGANPLSGGDPDVTGFFNFTIEDVYSVNQQNPNIKTLQVFTVPVGQCSGPIAVTKGDPAPSPPDPRQSLAFVSELPRAGFFLESIEVIPASRRNSADVLGFIVGVNNAGGDVVIPAPGGGFVDVVVQESDSTADETLVIFANRSNPGRVKVCKIAGPGIPINTLFTFTVSGIGATNAASPQTAIYGPVTRTFDVRAGDPASGGTCEFVPGFGANAPGFNQFQTFVNGTPVFIFENGISVNNTIPQNPGQLRASRIRQFGSAFTSTAIAGFSPNPNLTPAAATTELFSTGNIAVPILDVATIAVPVNVPDAGLISDVNVRLRLDHTFDADLDMAINNPVNQQVGLSFDNGGAGDNYGSGTNNCAGTFTIFDDEAVTPITAGTAPFAGTFQPQGLLSAFDGNGMNGTWNLLIRDDLGGDVGTVGCVQLQIANSEFVARAAVFARVAVVEVEFTNFRFNPTVLKVCKIAGTPALVGTDFNFTVALVSPVSQPDNVPLFPAFSQPVTVTAGPPGPQGGNCTFVNGSALLGGAFNQGSTITITETAGTVTDISCGSCGAGGLTADLPNRKATLSGPNGLVAGVNAVTFTNIAAIPPQERAVRYDFDGDHKSDVSVFTPSSGFWTWASSAEAGALKGMGFGVATDKLVPADYDGDRKADYAVWRPSTGQWFFNTGTMYEYHNWGEAGDIPQTGDWDGDGRADFAVFRPSNGTWYIKMRTGELRIFQFGIPTDKPYAADYDGDGRTDAGVFRNGTWYTLGSTQGFRITNFGQTGDIPVPADYDGDGAADIAVFRAGTWYMLSATNYTVKSHGNATDIPVPADYDGDNKTDLAVFRPAAGQWLIKKSSLGEGAGDDTVNLGSATDVALPGPQ